jgi:hypothetical protein
MVLCVRTALIVLAGVCITQAQQMSFADQVYPVLQSAGCAACHNGEGVASATRLRFPEEPTSKVRLQAFGKSLVEFVNRTDPEKSLLLLKPTLRIPHTGGERIRKATPEEKVLRSWIAQLAAMPPAEVASALEYRKREAAGHGQAPTVVLRRLTHAQYDNTVRDLLKDTTAPASRFPAEDYVNGFKNQYDALSVSPLLTQAYALAAERLAAHAFRRGDSRGLIPCKPSSETDARCRGEFVSTFGRNAFRRPLEREELLRYEQIFQSRKTFLAGAQAVIEAMLQSPNFIFWVEQSPNPKWKPYATAARLAYFIWNTTPDEALLENAAKGELNTADGVEKTVRKMLESPKARDGVDEFVAQWLRFDRVLASARERRVYPLFSQELARAMTEESKRFINDLIWNDRNFMEAFTANYSFINSDLAAIYKVPPPAQDFARVEFPSEAGRSGILGQASFLTLTSKPDDTAPTGRGLFVREQFLCQQVPPPPPDVDTNLPPVDEAKPVTNRERLAAHTTNQMCVRCHSLIDPVGFGFEKFDAIGMRREKHKLLFFPAGSGVAARRAKPKEVELEIDTQGFVAGLENSRFTTPRELGELLARTPQCHECIVKQVFRYMAGRFDTPADRPMLRQALETFRQSGFRFKELIVYLASAKDMQLSGRHSNVASNHKTQ